MSVAGIRVLPAWHNLRAESPKSSIKLSTDKVGDVWPGRIRFFLTGSLNLAANGSSHQDRTMMHCPLTVLPWL